MTALSPLRVDRVTGSRIGKLFNVSPYGDRNSLLREMVRQHFDQPDEFTGNIATRWGEDHEPDALLEYQRRYGVQVHQSVLDDGQVTTVHPDVDYLAITPDALVGDDGLIEAKCPYNAAYTHISQRRDYLLQVNLALEITGRDWADFVVWRRDGISVSRVERDPWWLETVVGDIAAYLAEYAAIIDDPAKAAKHLDALAKVRDDDDWVDAETTYLEALAIEEQSHAAVDAAKERLVTLRKASPDLPAKGHGVTLVRSTPKPSVSYAKAIKELAPDADLAPYTSEPAGERWTVRRSAGAA